MNFRLALATLALLTATPALAWDDTSDEDSCGFAQSFDSDTTLFVRQTKTGFDSSLIYIFVFNDNWSVVKDQKLTGMLRFEASDGSWMNETPIAVTHGVGGIFAEKHVEYFNDSSVTGVKISLNGKVLAQLDWDGFWSAFVKFNMCRRERGWLAERQAKKEEADRIEREKRYRQVVPVDPFATPAPKPTPKRMPTRKRNP